MKTKKIFIMYGAILSLIVCLVGGFFIFKTINQKTDVDGSQLTKDEFYSIRNNATQYQKDLYAELLEEVENESKDLDKISELVAQNFVADFYTWTNKFRKNDVGGLQFVREDIRTSVYQSAQQSVYGDMYYYLNNGGLKNTLEIEEVTVDNAEKIDFFIYDKEGSKDIYDEDLKKWMDGDYHEAYKVKVSWKYKNTDSFDSNVYDDEANVILMLNEKGVPMIVEVNQTYED